MIGLPLELEKHKIDMNKCFDIYKMLEEFNYRFTQDDLSKRWNVFAGPRDVMKLVDDRTNALEKLKAKFQEEMKTEQEEFKDEFETLDQTITGFHSY
jgi:dynein heavy chain